MVTSISFTAREISINGLSRNEVYVTADVENEGIDEILDSIDKEKVVEWLESEGYKVEKE